MQQDVWRQCYGTPWKGIATEACASHPAKYSKALIFRLVAHALEEQWVKPGQTVLDPFGGVGLGALPCALEGVQWFGCELEAHFVTLAQANFALWERRYGMLPQWRVPVLVQGDSRNLGAVLQGAGVDLCLSSPPHGDSLSNPSDRAQDIARALKAGHTLESMRNPGGQLRYPTTYGTHPAQLGNMPPGSVDAVVSSPPFGDSDNRKGGSDLYRQHAMQRGRNPDSAHATGLTSAQPYGTSPEQLGNATGDTFWAASRTILEQVYALLAPGGHAIWVTKSYVRNGKIVDFPHQWRRLAEHVGFITLHEHRALQVDAPADMGLFGEEVEYYHVEHKGFFRHTHEKKHPQTRIDYETIWCMQKLGNAAGEADGVTACVSSPPYGEGVKKEQVKLDASAAHIPSRKNAGPLPKPYGTSPGQLGAMRPGRLEMVLSSPPYAEALSGTNNMRQGDRAHNHARGRDPDKPGAGFSRHYGTTPGQLGAMDTGRLAMVISSPPYSGNEKSDYRIVDATGQDRDERRGKRQGKGSFRGSETYGKTPGQLGAMRRGAPP